MIDVTAFRGLKIGIFGLGKSGISAIYGLSAGKAEVLAWDDNLSKRNMWLEDLRPQFIAIAMDKILVDIEDDAWKSINTLVLSPGIPLDFPKPHRIVEIARQYNIPIICDIELLYQTCFNAKYIAITGTNGKSTTTSLIGHILKSANIRTEIGGNIGIPALDLQPLTADGSYVLELSSYQLDLLDKTHINIAIMLNITKDHIDRHGSMDGYIAAKTKIFNHQGKNDTAILGIDNPITKSIYDKLSKEAKIGNIIPISANKIIDGGVSVIDGVLYNNIKNANKTYELGEIKNLKGKHNAENIAASFACCYAYNVPPEQIIAAIKTFKGLKHRMEFLGETNGVTFVNDSKATNAEATEKALLSYDNIYWILGGVSKEGGIESLKPLFGKIKHAFLIGQATEEFAKVLDENNIAYNKSTTLETATFDAAKMALADTQRSCVLLSPACASFDQWENFEKRGEAFCSYIKSMQEKLGVKLVE